MLQASEGGQKNELAGSVHAFTGRRGDSARDVHSTSAREALLERRGMAQKASARRGLAYRWAICTVAGSGAM